MHDKDRLIFGGTACFKVKIPQEEAEIYGMNEKESKKDFDEIDWEYFQKELMAKVDSEKKKKEEIVEKEREKQGSYIEFSLNFIKYIFIFQSRQK